MIVFQKAWRNGRKRVVGSGRRMDARDLERRCWGMGLSVWKMPVRYDMSGYWKLGQQGRRTEEETFPDLEEFDGGKCTAGAEVGL